MTLSEIRKHVYYLGIAEAALANSTCLRRKYGAIIVKNDEIIATGYNGSPRGCPNCADIKHCVRNTLHTRKGDNYGLCLSVHAEMNAIISASRRDMIGATMYIVGHEAGSETPIYANPSPCTICQRLIINAGITACYGVFAEASGKDLTPYKVEAGVVLGYVKKIPITPKNFIDEITNRYMEIAATTAEAQAMEIIGAVDALRDDMSRRTAKKSK